ncbi:Hypothetical protein, predicted lipoprotein [Metamycoplasma auris 15026]|uniref:Variable surface lipoprotein n=1 Tax=Metamycoplasma auris 15026 TaxID=1188233 RepID=N9VB80_9BACT|nr:variable surface lipoprotein [Metamycoplasma auris]ENY68646.1 Hypothetical protein, predicted lipoprotein [Metamycoplasma auris 15026]
MKKLNKFLLAFGSITSLASLPLIAAKCGGTKENTKQNIKEEKNNSNINNNITNNNSNISSQANKAKVKYKPSELIHNSSFAFGKPFNSIHNSFFIFGSPVELLETPGLRTEADREERYEDWTISPSIKI